jgi:hypothetical protein
MKIEAAVARRRGRAGANRQMTPFDTPEYRRKDRARARAAAKALAEAQPAMLASFSMRSEVLGTEP